MCRNRNAISEIQIRRGLFVLFLVVVVSTAVTVGGVEQGPGETGTTASTAPAATTASSSEDVVTGGKIQTITFEKDRTIRDALRFLGCLYKKNIVPSLKVDGMITVTKLYDVTFEEALDALLGHSFKYEQQGNFIKVYTIEEYTKIKEDPSRKIYRVFTIEPRTRVILIRHRR